jgi:hypothetical protein
LAPVFTSVNDIEGFVASSSSCASPVVKYRHELRAPRRRVDRVDARDRRQVRGRTHDADARLDGADVDRHDLTKSAAVSLSARLCAAV